MFKAIKEVAWGASRTCLELFKVMVPIVIGVKIFQELGWIQYLAWPLEPIMALLGLPAEVGLVWATALVNNLYAGLVVYVALMPELPVMTAAQVTILGAIILIAHNLPVEARVTQKCGAKFWGQIGLRFASAFVYGLLLHIVCEVTGWLGQPAVVGWRPEAQAAGWGAWALGQLKMLGMVFVIILALMALLRLLESVGAIDLIKKLLGPVVELIGIDRRAVPMTVTGLAMGITYGSGLIIHEVRNGKASHQDAVASVSLMGLSHALIEDTIVLSLFGASVIGILWARMAFAMLVVALLFRIRPRWGAALALPKGSGAAAAG